MQLSTVVLPLQPTGVRPQLIFLLTVSEFSWSRFLIIRQNVNMATNAILYCGLTPSAYRGKTTVDLTVYCFRIFDGHIFL